MARSSAFSSSRVRPCSAGESSGERRSGARLPRDLSSGPRGHGNQTALTDLAKAAPAGAVGRLRPGSPGGIMAPASGLARRRRTRTSHDALGRSGAFPHASRAGGRLSRQPFAVHPPPRDPRPADARRLSAHVRLPEPDRGAAAAAASGAHHLLPHGPHLRGPEGVQRLLPRQVLDPRVRDLGRLLVHQDAVRDPLPEARGPGGRARLQLVRGHAARGGRARPQHRRRGRLGRGRVPGPLRGPRRLLRPALPQPPHPPRLLRGTR